MIRSDRIVGVSWKNVDSRGLAPTSLPVVRVRIACAGGSTGGPILLEVGREGCRSTDAGKRFELALPVSDAQDQEGADR